MLYSSLTEDQRKTAAALKINVVTGAITKDKNGDVYVIEYKDTCIYAYSLKFDEKKQKIIKHLLGELYVGCKSELDFFISRYNAENTEILRELFKYAENMAFEHKFERMIARKESTFNNQYNTTTFFTENGYHRITNSVHERIYENPKVKYREFSNNLNDLLNAVVGENEIQVCYS